MAGPLKVNGLSECANLRKRVIRQHQLGRIRRSDRDYLVELLDKFEARVIKMREEGTENGFE